MITDNDIFELQSTSYPLVGNCSGLYFLFDKEELVYIGRGWNCLLRVAEHTRRDTDKIFTSWNYLEFDDENERNTIERFYIQKFKPKYNIVHANVEPDNGVGLPTRRFAQFRQPHIFALLSFHP